MMSKIDKITFSLMSLMPLMSLMSQDPDLRPPTERKARTAPRAAAAGGGGRSVRRLLAPRRSSLEFEAARRPPRGKLVLTNLRSVERETLLPVIDRLVDVAVVEEVTPETTHVISGQSRRTVSVLGALAVGAWLLPPAWALASLEAGRWLPEAKYEQSDEWPAAGQRRRATGTASLAPPAAVDESALTETTFGGPGGPALAPAEEEEEKGTAGAGVSSGDGRGLALFAAAGPVYVSGSTRPPAAVLAGGVVAATARGATVAMGRPCRVVVTVTEQWLMDSLQMNRLLVRQRDQRERRLHRRHACCNGPATVDRGRCELVTRPGAFQQDGAVSSRRGGVESRGAAWTAAAVAGATTAAGSSSSWCRFRWP